MHRTALVLGAMSPDFIYFLQGRAANGFGHTWVGMWLLNLPLVCLFYALYRWRLRAVARAYLPEAWAFALPEPPPQTHFRRVVVFLFSALLGMATHIVWDAFTHHNGWFVERISFLNMSLGIPVYKWLQYGGGVFGLAYVAWVWRHTARRYPAPQVRTAAQKRRFWAGVLAATLLLWVVWQMLSPTWAVATQIIRIIDCALVYVVVRSLYEKNS
nr:DUF4184 family protein [Conchiformibius kuhniae]